GIPPRTGRELRDWLDVYKHREETLLLYESPHRVVKTLTALRESWGNRQAAIARELTKRYEEIARGTLDEAIARFSDHPPVGEFCLVIEGAAAGSHEAGDG